MHVELSRIVASVFCSNCPKVPPFIFLYPRMESTEKCDVVIQNFNGKFLKTPPGMTGRCHSETEITNPARRLWTLSIFDKISMCIVEKRTVSESWQSCVVTFFKIKVSVMELEFFSSLSWIYGRFYSCSHAIAVCTFWYYNVSLHPTHSQCNW